MKPKVGQVYSDAWGHDKRQVVAIVTASGNYPDAPDNEIVEIHWCRPVPTYRCKPTTWDKYWRSGARLVKDA
jgi:hypothetical protein